MVVVVVVVGALQGARAETKIRPRLQDCWWLIFVDALALLPFRLRLRSATRAPRSRASPMARAPLKRSYRLCASAGVTHLPAAHQIRPGPSLVGTQ